MQEEEILPNETAEKGGELNVPEFPAAVKETFNDWLKRGETKLTTSGWGEGPPHTVLGAGEETDSAALLKSRTIVELVDVEATPPEESETTTFK